MHQEMCCIKQIASFDGKLRLSARPSFSPSVLCTFGSYNIATQSRNHQCEVPSPLPIHPPSPSNRRFFVLQAGANGQPSTLRYEVTVPGNPGTPSFYPKVRSILQKLMAGHSPLYLKDKLSHYDDNITQHATTL
jgi:hypothetical protein